MVTIIGTIEEKEEYMMTLMFQWQNGELVPVYPKHVKEEAGTTLTFSEWPGPWDNIS